MRSHVDQHAAARFLPAHSRERRQRPGIGIAHFGDDAERMKETFEGPDAWGGMLTLYKDVAEATA